MDVLDRDQPDERRVRVVVVEGQLGDAGVRPRPAAGRRRGSPARPPDAAVGVLEHGAVELLLAAEVVVDHPLRGAGPLGDLVDPGAREALLGEDLGGHLRAARRGCGRRRAARSVRRRPAGMAPSVVAARAALVRRPATYVPYGSSRRLDEDVDRHRVPERHRWSRSCTPAPTAGFDGVEVFEPDLVAAPQSPEEIRALADRLGLTLDLYQPFRDAEGVDEDDVRAATLRRAEAKFALMQRLGIDTHAGLQQRRHRDRRRRRRLRRPAAPARRPGAARTASGSRSRRSPGAGTSTTTAAPGGSCEQADHPAVGVCLDSFHILSRGHDPAAIEQIPGEKVFFLQLADAPALSHGRAVVEPPPPAVPRRGQLRPRPASSRHVLATGYDGPLSLEVFNDTFRQTDPDRTARQALRSLRWLADGRRWRRGEPDSLPARRAEPAGFDFVEVKAEDTERGRGAARPARLHVPAAGTAARRSGCGPRARPASSLNEQQAPATAPRWPRSATRSPTPRPPPHARSGCWRRASTGGRTPARRSCAAVAAPDGTEVFLAARRADDLGRRVRAAAGRRRGTRGVTGDRPRQPGPAVAALRRGGAVLQPRARPGDPGVDRGGRARRGWSAAR